MAGNEILDIFILNSWPKKKARIRPIKINDFANTIVWNGQEMNESSYQEP
jgi:hypothetical protein